MSHGDILTHRHRQVVLHMDHAVVLNVGTLADGDGGAVTPQHRVIEHAAAGGQLYVAPDDSAGRHKNGGMDSGLFHGKRILSVFFHIVPRFFRITSVSGKIS